MKINIFWKIRDCIDSLFLNLKSFYLRGKNGWSPKDTWDFDYYLAKVIAQGLKHLKENNNSTEPTKKEFDTMITGFESAIKIIETNSLNNNKNLILKFNRGMELFKQKFFCLWD